MKNWSDLVRLQVEHFKGAEGKLFDKVDQFFLGNAWAETTVGESEAALVKTSTNFSYPLVETATSVLLPPNPQITIDPEKLFEEIPPEVAESQELLTNWFLRVGGYKGELSTTLQDSVKYGLGVTKTTWDFENDRPETRRVNRRCYHFDRAAERWDDVRYEFEALVLSRHDLEKRVKSGMYGPAVLERGGDRWPSWIGSADREALATSKNWQPWYLVYEVYDRERGAVYHLLDDKTVFEDEIAYRPYDVLSFSFNGKDIGGVSEIGLILANQEDYNWTETFILNVLRHGAPGLLYNSSLLTEKDVGKALSAPLGSATGIPLPQGMMDVSSAFAPRPAVPMPIGIEGYLASKREGMAYVSAINDAMRSQVLGAKTATELAFLEGNTRNRLRPRQDRVDELTVSVAEKQHLLASRWMRRPKTFRPQQGAAFRTVAPWDIEGVRAAFKMVAYSPMETNKAVRLETIKGLYPQFSTDPMIDQRALRAEMLRLMDLEHLLLPPEAVAPPQTPPGAGGGAAPPPGPPSIDAPGSEAPSALPPRAAAFSDAVSAPAQEPPA